MPKLKKMCTLSPILSQRFHVFVDLSTDLSSQQKADIFSALEEIVPNSGCVGPLRTGGTEIYFSVHASSSGTAEATAHSYVAQLFNACELHSTYILSVTRVRCNKE